MQIKQLKARKEKAIQDPEFRELDNKIKTEQSAIKMLKRDAQGRYKQLKTAQKLADDNRRAGASTEDKAILDQIKKLKDTHDELVAEKK